MNHLIKNIKFYKELKDSDTNAINNLFTYKRVKKIYYDDFIIIKVIEENIDSCTYCFENIYSCDLPYISIKLGNRYFYLNKAKNQIFENQFNIIDLIHTSDKKLLLDRSIIEDFFNYFPSFTLIIKDSHHNHLIASLLEAPILNCDATFLFDNTYKLNWYLETYLIVNIDINILYDEYLSLSNKFKDKKQYLIINKKGKKFYLYLIILKNNDISIYEACGIIITSDDSIKYSEIVSKLKDKLTL